MSRPRWVANAALVVVATLVPLIAIEAGLRIAGTVPPGIYEPDSTVIYRLAPNGRKHFVHNVTNGGGSVPVEINADGFRGPALRPIGSARRLAVYGDSFIEGEFVADDSSFVRVLERTLAARTPTEVVNGGVVGWGPDQAFLRMMRELPTLKPAVVVLGIFADNDMGDITRDRLFQLGPDSALDTHHVTLHPTLWRVLDEQSHPTGWRRLHIVRWFERRLSRGAGALPATRTIKGGPAFSLGHYAEWALANAERQYDELRQSPDTVLDLLGDSYDADVSATPDAISARYKVAVMDRLLGAIADSLTARQVPLVLVVIPSPIDACDTYDAKIDAVKYPRYDRRRLTHVVDSLATRHGIRTLDLWAPFRARGACDLYFHGGDLHWNPEGQLLAARLLADSLAAWHFVP